MVARMIAPGDALLALCRRRRRASHESRKTIIGGRWGLRNEPLMTGGERSIGMTATIVGIEEF